MTRTSAALFALAILAATADAGCVGCPGVPPMPPSIEVVLPPRAGVYRVVASWGADTLDCEAAITTTACGYYGASCAAPAGSRVQLRASVRCIDESVVVELENVAARPEARFASVRVERDGAVVYAGDVTLHFGADVCDSGPHEIVEP